MPFWNFGNVWKFEVRDGAGGSAKFCSNGIHSSSRIMSPKLRKSRFFPQFSKVYLGSNSKFRNTDWSVHRIEIFTDAKFHGSVLKNMKLLLWIKLKVVYYKRVQIRARKIAWACDIWSYFLLAISVCRLLYFDVFELWRFDSTLDFEIVFWVKLFKLLLIIVLYALKPTFCNYGDRNFNTCTTTIGRWNWRIWCFVTR